MRKKYIRTNEINVLKYKPDSQKTSYSSGKHVKDFSSASQFIFNVSQFWNIFRKLTLKFVGVR
jgi:hypothetical protein